MFGGHSFSNSFRWCVSCVITVTTKSSYVYTRHNVCKTDIITLVSFGEKKKDHLHKQKYLWKSIVWKQIFFFFFNKERNAQDALPTLQQAKFHFCFPKAH